MRNMQFSGLLWAHHRGLSLHRAPNPSGSAASQSFSSLCTKPGLSCPWGISVLLVAHSLWAEEGSEGLLALGCLMSIPAPSFGLMHNSQDTKLCRVLAGKGRVQLLAPEPAGQHKGSIGTKARILPSFNPW